MQEEVENRTVNLAISTTKLTARTVVAGVKKYLAHRSSQKAKKTALKQAKAAEKPVGKQTVEQLIGQNQGAQTIDIASTDIRGFERYANKYGVDYAIKKDITQNPPKYVVFFKARDADVLQAALKEYTAATFNKKRPDRSVLKELGKYKQLAAALPKKVRDKVQELGRG